VFDLIITSTANGRYITSELITARASRDGYANKGVINLTFSAT